MKGELKYRERGEGKGGRIREEGTGWGRVEGDCEDGEGWRNEGGEGLLVKIFGLILTLLFRLQMNSLFLFEHTVYA